MQQIVFASREAAQRFQSTEPWAAISITDPGSAPAEIACPECQAILRLSFSDVDHREDDRAVVFSPAMAREILEFVQAWAPRVRTLVIHCEAGVSRSCATAAALARLRFGDDQEFFLRGRPNMLVYRTLLEEALREASHEAARTAGSELPRLAHTARQHDKRA
ncbi:MAG: hypothetical protein ACE147_15640 [Candidatus Methylomirabilales bacterium]